MRYDRPVNIAVGDEAIRALIGEKTPIPNRSVLVWRNDLSYWAVRRVSDLYYYSGNDDSAKWDHVWSIIGSHYVEFLTLFMEEA